MVKVGDIVSWTPKSATIGQLTKARWQNVKVVSVNGWDNSVTVEGESGSRGVFVNGDYEIVGTEKTDQQLADELRQVIDRRSQIVTELNNRGYTVRVRVPTSGAVSIAVPSEVHEISKTEKVSL